MKTSIWRKQWVYGVCDNRIEAEDLVRSAEADGIKSQDIVVIGPDHFKPRAIADVLEERHHPEIKWMAVGGVVGFLVTALAGFGVLTTLEFAPNLLLRTMLSVILGFGGGIAGAFLTLQWMGIDASLTALYEESGLEGRYLVAIRCHPDDAVEIHHAENAIRHTGIAPVDFPQYQAH